MVKMKITLCGSTDFVKEINGVEKELKKRGHEVFTLDSIHELNMIDVYDSGRIRSNRKKYINNIKPNFMKRHFDKVKKADAVLIVNVDKHGIRNYIGGNTFAELMFAYYHDKKIFLLNPVPTDEKLSCIVDEIESVQPIVINQNFDLVK